MCAKKYSQILMRMNRTVSVLLILTFFNLLNAAEANEGLSILAKAYQNSGFNPSLIRSGIAEFEMTSDWGDSTPSRLFEEMHRKDVEMIKERYKGDEKKMALEIERVRASHKESKRRIVQEKIKILMLGNDRAFGGEPGEQYKRLYVRHVFVPSLNKWVHESIDLTFGTLVLRPNVIKSQLLVHWIPNNRDLIIYDTNVKYGEFQEFGRFQEAAGSCIADILRNKIDRKTFTLPTDFQGYFENRIQSLGLSVRVVGDVDYDDGAKAKIIEVKKGDRLLEKYHIDTDRGYLCPYQYVMGDSGKYSTERTTKEYFVEKKTGLYYPKNYHEVNFFIMEGVANKTDTEYRLISDTLRLNQAVSDKEFAIDISESARVADFRVPDKPMRYVAIKNGTISLAKGGYDFSKLPWLLREEDLKDYVPPRGGASGWVRVLLAGIGIVMIVVALYQKWKKR